MLISRCSRAGLFHVKLLLTLSLGAGILACAQPAEVLQEPESLPPTESKWGLRLTNGPGADVVRGVTPEGRIVYRTRDLIPYGSADVIATIAPTGGTALEEAAIYRQAIEQPVGSLSFANQRRVLATWSLAEPGVHGCPTEVLADSGGTVIRVPTGVPDPGPVVGTTVIELDLDDGTAIPSLPSLSIPIDAVEGAGTLNQRVRVLPAHHEVTLRGVNPFGPALLGADSFAISDGEMLWLGSIADGMQPIGSGAFPAVSPDGATLAFARPLGVDSTVQIYTVTFRLGVCVHEHVDITATGWEIVLRDVASGSEQVVGAGLEPVFDPVAQRLLVRLPSGLHWVAFDGTDLGDLGAPVGAFAPTITPDGLNVAYSYPGDGNTDVFVLPVQR